MKFTKMHGLGNDYVYVNCFEEKIDFDNVEEMIISLSDRHFGVGGDGVIFICPSEVADAKMVMYNADGSRGKMCGNGIRCVGKYVYDHGISKNNPLKIETDAGIKVLDLKIENDEVEMVTVDMGAPILLSSEIPVDVDKDRVINMPLVVEDKPYEINCVSMGNPHCVIFVDDVDGIDLATIGPVLENHELFPERINVEFCEIINDKELKMRVWERGSGETLACGTGACACVVAATLNGKVLEKEVIKVHLIGGVLEIKYDGNVYMSGTAVEVFSGEVKERMRLKDGR